MRKFLVGVLAFSMTLTMPGMVSVLGVSGVPQNTKEEYEGEMEAIIELPPEYADAVTDSTGLYKYIINADETVTLTKYLNPNVTSDLIIPEKVDGYTVSAIGNSFAKACYDLTSVTIPTSVKALGTSAFSECSKLKNMTLAEGLESIGEYCFYGCNRLTQLVIPASVNAIGDGAFDFNYSIPIIIVAGNKTFKIIDNVIYSYDGKELILYRGMAETFSIPESVEKICASAFGDNDYLKSIVIPDTVKEIGEFAFIRCYELSSLKIGRGISEISYSCFNSCPITELVVPGNVKTIGRMAFSGCEIENLTLEEGVEKIEQWAFNSNEMETLTIPASLKSMDGGVFDNCKKIKEIKVAEGSEYFKIVDSSLLTMDGKNFVLYPVADLREFYEIPTGVEGFTSGAFTCATNLKRVEFPKTTQSITVNVFDGCTALESVVLSGNIKNIREYAFSMCSNLKSVYIPSSVTRISHGVFWYCDSLTNIYYVGSEEQWGSIKINTMQNTALDNATIYFMSNLRMFVERMYWDALGRAFDDYGLNSWVQMLVAGTHDGAGLAKEFVLGDEFAMRNLSDEEYVDVLYETFFDRAADETGKMLWMGELASGKSRAYVLSKLVNLPEFTALCAEYDILRGVMFEDGNVATPGCVQFVGRLYDLVMGRDADNDGLYTWTFALSNGLANAQEVATQFFNSAEYAAKNTSNETYVTDLYGVFMDRTPDEAGLAFWVSCLAEQGVSRDWVLSEFAKSEEFKMIAARYGIQ